MGIPVSAAGACAPSADAVNSSAVALIGGCRRHGFYLVLRMIRRGRDCLRAGLEQRPATNVLAPPEAF